MQSITSFLGRKTIALKWSVRNAIDNNNGEGFVDTAVKILMAVVIGALLLGGLYMLFSNTILPTLTERIQNMFDYSG